LKEQKASRRQLPGLARKNGILLNDGEYWLLSMIHVLYAIDSRQLLNVDQVTYF